MHKNKNMKKNNYIATANCDGEEKYFTVHNVTKPHSNRVAKAIGRSLFCATCITILSLTIIK